MRKVGLALLLLATGCVKAKPASGPALPRRDLTVTYEARIGAVPVGAKKLMVWIPIPRDERVQVLESVAPQVEGAKTEIVSDAAHGNPALQVTIANPKGDLDAKVACAVSRVEEKPGSAAHPMAQPSFAG